MPSSGRSPRPAVAGTAWARTTPAEKLAAIDRYYASFGTCGVDTAAQTITHTVVASLRPHEAGLKYLRRFDLAGGGPGPASRLLLATDRTGRD